MNGNYVEDQYGRDLAKMETRGVAVAFMPQSTSQESYIGRSMVEGPATRTSSSRTPWMTSEVGCRAELLFSHDGDLPAPEGEAQARRAVKMYRHAADPARRCANMPKG